MDVPCTVYAYVPGKGGGQVPCDYCCKLKKTRLDKLSKELVRYVASSEGKVVNFVCGRCRQQIKKKYDIETAKQSSSLVLNVLPGHSSLKDEESQAGKTSSQKLDNPDCYVSIPPPDCENVTLASSPMYPSVPPPSYQSLFPNGKPSSFKRTSSAVDETCEEGPRKLTSAERSRKECILKTDFAHNCLNHNVVPGLNSWKNEDLSSCFNVSIQSSSVYLCQQHYQQAKLFFVNKHYNYCNLCHCRLSNSTRCSVPDKDAVPNNDNIKLCWKCYKSSLQNDEISWEEKLTRNEERMAVILEDAKIAMQDTDLQVQTAFLPEVAFFETALLMCRNMRKNSTRAFLLVDIYDQYCENVNKAGELLKKKNLSVHFNPRLFQKDTAWLLNKINEHLPGILDIHKSSKKEGYMLVAKNELPINILHSQLISERRSKRCREPEVLQGEKCVQT